MTTAKIVQKVEPFAATATGAVVGVAVGGPIGLGAGAGIGALIDWWRHKKTSALGVAAATPPPAATPGIQLMTLKGLTYAPAPPPATASSNAAQIAARATAKTQAAAQAAAQKAAQQNVAKMNAMAELTLMRALLDSAAKSGTAGPQASGSVSAGFSLGG